MSISSNPFSDYVFSLSQEDFTSLKEAINQRIDKDKYGFKTYEEAALHFERQPACPRCQSTEYHLDGKTSAGHIRYRCKKCNESYTLLSDSIFNSAKLPMHKLMNYIELMSFNVPLQLLCEVLDISSNTAELWRKKIFETVNTYQDNLMLSGRVWIDETYIEDYEVLAIQNGKHLRGLSKSKVCIVVAIDAYKNMIAVVSGHGKPSSKRIMDALKNHIAEHSTIVHDGERAHYKLIKELHCKEEFYKANTKDQDYLDHMELINNMCSWLKRYIWRFIGMDINNLQSYLNWFVYMHRVKYSAKKWPKNIRVLRHLVLSRAKFTRKY